MSSTRSIALICLATLAVVLGAEGHARDFSRCHLSKELQRYNFPRHMLARWVCVIEHASGRTTNKTTNHNNGYTSYGLFQINNKEWCKKGKKGGLCVMKCENLLNEDLTDDVRCAKRIFDRVGFKGWPVSYAFCKEKNLPDLSKCN